jgi:1-aminocyclopropane-1-carboxylate deaminase/D-cysteine desulfhydrase-like pyridoxal-dependent ACC family enzyme
MYSLSILAKLRGWKFTYYSRVADYLKENPHGNYYYALEQGMKVNETEVPEYFPNDTLFIPEGGAGIEAYEGVALLAKEVHEWFEKEPAKHLMLFLPSGTGTTALFLQKALKKLGSSIKVVTTPCVGDESYLKEQFYALEKYGVYHPTIVKPPKKFHFGKLYRENYKIWLKLHQETGVEFDLLYDPIGWQTLLMHYATLQKPILYLHQGGLIGNESMLKRYQHKFKDNDENL